MTNNPANPAHLPELVNLTTGERHVLADPIVTLGRAPDNSVILPDDGYASAAHARIYWDQNSWWIEDMMSSNGTAVNDQLIQAPWQLAPNDNIKIGRTIYRIE